MSYSLWEEHDPDTNSHDATEAGNIGTKASARKREKTIESGCMVSDISYGCV